jgi:hypothetical protein
MNGINLTGGIALTASGATLDNSIAMRLTESYGALWSGGDGTIWHHQVINASMLCGFTGGGTNWGSGKIVASSDVRGTLFYDYNDTTYYINPNSTSAIKGAIIIGPNAAYSAYLRLGGEGQLSDIATISASNGNLHLDSKNTFQMYLNYSSNGIIYVNNGGGYLESQGSSIRAPLFYDTNNTAYYVDAAGTSRLGDVQMGNVLNLNGWQESVATTSFRGIEFHSVGDRSYYIGKPAGAWTQPLEIVFFTGLRYRAHISYGGHQFYDLNDGGLKFSISNGSNIVSSAVAFHAPIVYDSNDTAAYLDMTAGSWIKAGFQMNVASASNDVFGGLEMREAGLVAASQSAATYAPGINFHWGSRAAARIYMDAGGSFVLGGQSDITNNRRTLFCADLNATGNITAYYSDDRLKTRIGNIENALDIVSSLNGFRYVDNELAKTFGYANEGAQIGVSAQEVQKHLPEIVRGAAFDVDHDDPNHGSKSGENYLTVDYSRMVPLLIEAIKEQQAHINRLEEKIIPLLIEAIKEQQEQIKRLEEKVNSLGE